MKRKNISSGAKWEEVVGYSRAVRIGNVIEVSGTTAVKAGVVQHVGDAYNQTKLALQIILDALIQADCRLTDVIRTRIYVTNIKQWEEVARAHSEFFSAVKPATTMVEVKALIDPAMLVEIEATAVISEYDLVLNRNSASE
jgi:enamine deaminase RidA (YjgF/YER057c/UK114 family)